MTLRSGNEFAAHPMWAYAQQQGYTPAMFRQAMARQGGQGDGAGPRWNGTQAPSWAYAGQPVQPDGMVNAQHGAAELSQNDAAFTPADGAWGLRMLDGAGLWYGRRAYRRMNLPRLIGYPNAAKVGGPAGRFLQYAKNNRAAWLARIPPHMREAVAGRAAALQKATRPVIEAGRNLGRAAAANPAGQVVVRGGQAIGRTAKAKAAKWTSKALVKRGTGAAGLNMTGHLAKESAKAGTKGVAATFGKEGAKEGLKVAAATGGRIVGRAAGVLGRAIPLVNAGIAILDGKQFINDLKDPNASVGRKLVSGITAALAGAAALTGPGVGTVLGLLSAGTALVRDFL